MPINPTTKLQYLEISLAEIAEVVLERVSVEPVLSSLYWIGGPRVKVDLECFGEPARTIAVSKINHDMVALPAVVQQRRVTYQLLP